MTAKTPRIVTIGEAMVEFAPVTDGLFHKAFAGDTFNTAWHMAQLLRSRANVGFATRIGMDPTSDQFMRALRADGLDVTGITRDPDRSMGLYVIELDGVERRFQYWRDNSAARRLADDHETLRRAVNGADWILVSGITLAILAADARGTLLSALKQARLAGARIVFDPNVRPRLWPSPDDCRAAMRQMLRQTDIALPSFDDEAALWGDKTPTATLHRIAAAGVPEIVVKNGPGDVPYLSDGQTGSQATPRAAAVRDTTGAGDGFNAGYIAARCLGQTADHAIALGQRLAGLVIAHPGAKAPKDQVAELSGVVPRA